MNNLLIMIMSLTSILVFYWVLVGQWKQNTMFRQNKIKAILFDLDGVLIDSHDAWFNVFNLTRKKFKLQQIKIEEFDKHIWGGSIEREAKIYFKNIKVEEIAKIYYSNLSKFTKDIKINPYLHYTLKNIKDKKLKLGIVTNSYRKPVLSILNFHGIKGIFDIIIAGDEIKIGKPDPEGILKACKKLKVSPEETLFIGDTKNDINAGKNAGCFTIGYNIDGDLKIDNLKDILKLLK